jgi:hypothetical protein
VRYFSDAFAAEELNHPDETGIHLLVLAPQNSVPDPVPDFLHLAAFWCNLVLRLKMLSQGTSASCTLVYFGAIVSAGF